MKNRIIALLTAILLLLASPALINIREAAADNEDATPTPEIIIIRLESTTSTTPDLTPSPTQDPEIIEIQDHDLNLTDIEWLARLAFLSPLTEPEYKAALMWLVLNRVDSENFPNTVQLVIEQRGEFSFWSENKYIKPENLATNKELARLVLNQWLSEKEGCNAGRSIPKDALFLCFTGESNRNLELLSERGGTPLYYPIRGAYGY